MTETATEPVRAREYETIYVLRPDVTPDSAGRVARRVEEAVAREGGKLTLVETWGRRQLAYTVGRHRRGIYLYVKYVGAGGIVTELERNLRMLDDVIKFMTVQVRGDVELESLAVDESSVQFDPLEIPEDEEPEPTLAETLGLVVPERVESPRSAREPVAEAAEAPSEGQNAGAAEAVEQKEDGDAPQPAEAEESKEEKP